MWKYVKYIEKLMIFKSQYCFANISAMKASIFMKGPVSGFVGLIPHPSLESRIDRNH